MCAFMPQRINPLWSSDAIFRQTTRQIWIRQWPVASSAPSHYLYQCYTVNWIYAEQFQWNSNKITKVYLQQNTPENVICKILAILSRPEYVITGHSCHGQVSQFTVTYFTINALEFTLQKEVNLWLLCDPIIILSQIIVMASKNTEDTGTIFQLKINITMTS